MLNGLEFKDPLTSAAQKHNKAKHRLAGLVNMNQSYTTTEINTEIKVEVKLETTSIVKVAAVKHNQTESVNTSKQAVVMQTMNIDDVPKGVEKTREEIKAEREAKKLAKQAKKTKSNVGKLQEHLAPKKVNTPAISNVVSVKEGNIEKSAEQSNVKEEIKKKVKQTSELSNPVAGAAVEDLAGDKLHDNKAINATLLEEKKKPSLTKAERRAIQDAQRAAKSQAQNQKESKNVQSKSSKTAITTSAKTVVQEQKTEVSTPSTSAISASVAPFNDGVVRLFRHLERPNSNINVFINNPLIHPSITRLGEQYAKRTIVGSNARCIAFMNAMKMVVQDFETPPKKEFNRSLEAFMKNCVNHLQQCRPLAVSVTNAYKNIKQILLQLPTDQPESELKGKLFSFIDTYIENQIYKAAQAINSMMQKKINNGDVILTFGCSSLINYICEEAQARKTDFRVIIVDSRPFCEGQELLRRLTAKDIPCTYVLINALSFVMPEVTKVLLGAHALLANGYVMARTGTSQVALVARSFNVPVLVCCETHKFSERFQTDAIVYNELGNPDGIVVDDKLTNWQMKNISPLNLNYDITPPELVTAVVTEVAVLPCTSVPVILRIKPDWLMYAT
uniref:Translation initiation factor eIF2B subunit delta n=1 Tax=Glossina pallidipes TaxID=7398 RepID=A0A1B0AAZ1_GLOPL